jgi:hypothetical protein
MAFDTGFQTNRMMELRNRQRQRQEEQFRLTQEPHFGAPRSGFMNEHDYISALNEDSELANLESLNAGKGPARSMGFYPAQGLRQSRPGVGSMSLTGGDQFAQQDEYQDRVRAQNESQPDIQRQKGADTMRELGEMDAITGSLQPRGRRALDLGYTADAARKVGDIQRSEGLNNARAEAGAFMDPTVSGARKTANAEQESLLESRYGRQADAEAKIRAAEIAAQGKTGAASITARGGVTRDAIKGLLKSRELQGLIGGQTLDPSKMQDVEDLLWRGLQPGETMGQNDLVARPGVDEPSFQALLAGAAGGNQAGQDQLAQYWDQLTPEQQAVVRQRLGRQ